MIYPINQFHFTASLRSRTIEVVKPCLTPLDGLTYPNPLWGRLEDYDP